MKKNTATFTQCYVLAFSIACLVAAFLLIPGCALGRNELDGDVVFGVGLGRFAENANQAAAGAIEDLDGLLPPPFGKIASLGGLLLLGHMQGTRKGWDEREAAASVQTPLPTGAKA